MKLMYACMYVWMWAWYDLKLYRGGQSTPKKKAKDAIDAEMAEKMRIHAEVKYGMV